jgi:hypothetical protein
MTRRLYSLLLVAAASGALIAGCGGSSSPSTTPKTTPAKTTPASTTPATTTPSSLPTPTSAELKAGATACKSAETHDSTLSSTAKTYLSSICNDLAAGNVSALKSDAEKYCSAVLASVPAAEKGVAQAECKAIDNDF